MEYGLGGTFFEQQLAVRERRRSAIKTIPIGVMKQALQQLQCLGIWVVPREYIRSRPMLDGSFLHLKSRLTNLRRNDNE